MRKDGFIKLTWLTHWAAYSVRREGRVNRIGALLGATALARRDRIHLSIPDASREGRWNITLQRRERGTAIASTARQKGIGACSYRP